MKRLILLILGNVVVFCSLILMLEGGLALLYRFPPSVPFIHRAVKRFNLSYERQIMQYTPECFEHVEQLSYHLIPNHRCRFSSREYSIEISSNSMGLRDDEASLQQPQVIILGDSQAMGWGVHQDETIEAVLERADKLKVLNAAIPSYATVRQLRLLKMLDRTALKYLVIAYNDNDYNENLIFKRRKNQLDTMRPQDYRLLQRRHANDIAGRPFGKYMRLFWPLLVEKFTEEERVPRARKLKRRNREEASLFLNVLYSSDVDLTGVELILVEIDDDKTDDALFLNAVSNSLKKYQERNSGKLPMNLKTFHYVDLDGKLSKEHYYPFDDHINAAGTALAAKEIGALL